MFASNTWLNFEMDFIFSGSTANPRRSTPWATTSFYSRRFMSLHFAWSGPYRWGICSPLSMNYQSTQNMQASVSGTIRHFEPAIVASVNVNEVCTLMMHFHDVCTRMICTIMILLYDFMLNFNDMQCIWFYVKKYIHHRSFQIKRK